MLPHYLYFAPIANMKAIVKNKLEEIHITYLKKILGLKKHHSRENLL
jgi:hypothetical protein